MVKSASFFCSAALAFVSLLHLFPEDGHPELSAEMLVRFMHQGWQA